MKRYRYLILLLVFMLISGCTNSPTVLKVLYGQFDNFMARELLSYASFTKQQKTLIRAAVDETVSWHRTQALPAYVEVMHEAQQRLLNKMPEEADIDWLYVTSLELAKDFEKQSPLLKILPVVAELSDAQLVEVGEKIDEEFADERKEMEKEADQDPAELSTKNMSKFLKRLGLKLNKAQKANATIAFQQRQLSEAQRMDAWQQWADQLMAILQQRRAADFMAQFQQHYRARFTLIERTYPDAWQHDEAVGKAMTLELFQSLTEKQKAAMRARLDSLAGVAEDLSTS